MIDWCEGALVWYGGYEHRVTAVWPDGHLSVASDRHGAPTAFRGYTHQLFVTSRGPTGSTP